MRDRQTALLLFVLLTVLACTGYVGYVRTHTQDFAALAAHINGSDSRPFRAIVVFRPEDCDGRIDFMHAFERPRWRESFATGALVIGRGAEAKTAAQTLIARGLPMPVSAIGSEAHPGRSLGYVSTPYLLVVDRDDRLRMVFPGPASTSDVRAFDRAVEALLDPAGPLH